MLHLVQAALAIVFPALVIVGALSDVASYTIPNRLSLALVAAFPLAALAMGLPLAQIGLHAGLGAAALALGVVMFALAWVGGGDAKLFAAAALWLGWPALATFGIMTALAGGVLALTMMVLRSGYLRPYVVTGPAWFTRLADRDEKVPYGVAICAGALMAFPASPFMKALSGF